MNNKLSPYDFFIKSFDEIEKNILNSKENYDDSLKILFYNSLIVLSIKAISKKDFNFLLLDFYSRFKHEEEKEAQIYFSFHKSFRQSDVTDTFPNTRVFSFSINSLNDSQRESFRALNSLFDSIMWDGLSKDNSFFDILKEYINKIEVENEILS